MSFPGSLEERVGSTGGDARRTIGSCTELVTNPRLTGGRKLVRGGYLRTNDERGEARTITGHLPPEILLAIFYFASAPPKPSDPNFTLVVSLTHVCHLWRAILLQNARLWSNVHITGQPLDMLATQIARCRRAPLFVFIEAPPRPFTKSPRYLKLQTNVQEAARLVLERRDQIERLEVRMNCRAFMQQLGYEWPNLVDFVWIDPCLAGSCPHAPAYGGSVNVKLPRLKNLHIEGGIQWPMNVAAQLTTFKLKGPIELEASALTNFFRRNTSLQSLDLNNLNVLESSRNRRGQPIELLYLTKLSVHNATSGHILSLLTLPSLKQLWVTSLKGRSVWSGYDWSELCPRLLLTTIKVEYHAYPSKRIVVEGGSGLDTQSLRFAEFSPVTQGAAMFRSLANIPLASVISIALIDNMPEGNTSLPTAEICAQLEHLPRVRTMRLCPSDLALEVVWRLRDDLELCPELRELEVTVTGQTCRTVAEVMVEMVKARGVDGGGRMMKVGYFLPKGSQRREVVRVRRVWSRLWEKVELEKYLSDE